MRSLKITVFQFCLIKDEQGHPDNRGFYSRGVEISISSTNQFANVLKQTFVETETALNDTKFNI